MGIIIATLILVVVIASALAQDTEWPWGEITEGVQAVGSVVAAFLGFLGGVLIKYGLDRRADRLRRETDRRVLATALRAELVHLNIICASNINAFEDMLNEKPETEILAGPLGFAFMVLPPRRVWMAHLGRIGELEAFDPEHLILVHSSFDSYDLRVQISQQRAGGQGVNRVDLQERVDDLKHIRGEISAVGRSLIEQTKVGPSWWRRILCF